MGVGTSFRCQDLFDNRSANYVGDVGIGINPKLAERVKEADVLLVIGARIPDDVGERREVDLGLAPPNFVGVEVHLQIRELEAFGRVFALARAAEDAVDPSHELRERERLRQVVVTTGVEAGDAIDDPVSCGEEEHRRLQAARPQRLAEVAAVGIWQPDVDYERVDARPVDVFERRGAGGNRVHGEAFLA